jgi:hypothetical protein
VVQSNISARDNSMIRAMETAGLVQNQVAGPLVLLRILLLSPDNTHTLPYVSYTGQRRGSVRRVRRRRDRQHRGGIPEQPTAA